MGERILVPPDEIIGVHCSRCGFPMDMNQKDFDESPKPMCEECGGEFKRREGWKQ